MKVKIDITSEEENKNPPNPPHPTASTGSSEIQH